MENYKHSFRLFAEMMTQEIGNHPEPDAIWDYLKSIDSKMLEIEGDTFHTPLYELRKPLHSDYDLAASA